jgi:hypothetical protein
VPMGLIADHVLPPSHSFRIVFGAGCTYVRLRRRPRSMMQEPLTLESLKLAATAFTTAVSGTPIKPLYGVTDGKAVGTHVEVSFNNFILENYMHRVGSAARGLDFPDLNVDLKVTSVKQPQSSCPFRDAMQKVYGLGYHLLVMVYDKFDDPELVAAKLNFVNVLFIDKSCTGDYQITRGIHSILRAEGNADDIDAYLEDRNLPLDPESRRHLAERLLSEPPELGLLTISNAQQWRLQYSHAIRAAREGSTAGLEDLLAQQ